MTDSRRRWSHRSAGVTTALASVMLYLTGDVAPGTSHARVEREAGANVNSMHRINDSSVFTVAAAVRPHVAVRVQIESDLYRKKLDGDAAACGTNCAALQAALSDTVRALFASRFRFADWSSGGTPTLDTISIRLLQRSANASAVKMVVSLQGRARQYGSTAEEVEFEQFLFIVLRQPADWASARLRTVWADSLGRRLDTFGSRILSNVIGRLPLVGDVVFDAERRSASVQLSADSLRAADTPAPKFLVRISMPTSTPTGDIVPDTGELVLEPCRRTSRGFYSCEMGVFRWRDRSGSDTLFRQKAKNSTVKTASVHLREYTAAPASLGAGGVAAPRNP